MFEVQALMAIINLVIAVLVVLDINFCTRLSLNLVPDICIVSPNCYEFSYNEFYTITTKTVECEHMIKTIT